MVFTVDSNDLVEGRHILGLERRPEWRRKRVVLKEERRKATLRTAINKETNKNNNNNKEGGCYRTMIKLATAEKM